MISHMSWFMDKKGSLHSEKIDTSCRCLTQTRKAICTVSTLLAHSCSSLVNKKAWGEMRTSSSTFLASQPAAYWLYRSLVLLYIMCYVGSSSPYRKNQDGVGKRALFHVKLVTTDTSQPQTEVAEFQNKPEQNSYSFHANSSFPWPMPLDFKALC